MADHNKPTTTSNYTDLITEFDGRLDDQALGYDPATCSPTNVKTNALGWSSASNKWQRFNGSTWVDMSSLYAINISGNAATATSATNATQLGGQAASYYAPKASPTFTGIASFEKIANATLFANGAGAEGGELRLEKPATGSTLVGNVIVDIFGDYVRIFDAGGTNKGACFSIVACENSAATTLWNSSNDGAGSGMNADLLDGYQSSTGTTASTVPVRDGSGKLPGDITGNAATVTNGVYANQSNTYGAGAVQTVILNTNEGIATSPDGTHGVEVRGNGTGGAFMTFHRPGSHAVQFGLDNDDKLKVGGWSLGNNAYDLIHSGLIGTGLSFSGGLLNCTVSGGTRNVQTFTSSGTWTKPGGAPADAIAIIEVWGGGGSGGKGANNAAGGGGGGGLYRSKIVPLSALAATVATTVGAGGSAQTTASTHGNAGGASSFGSLVVAQGGGGGGLAAVASTNDAPVSPGGGGGGGGGCGQTTAAGLGAGSHPAALGGNGGTGAGGMINATVGVFGDNAGGGGGGAQASRPGANGGDSISGGGGGGGGGVSAANAPGNGGVSSFGGNGGAGAYDANAATAGTAPGGGGGGSETGTSGAGANGKVVVTVIW